MANNLEELYMANDLEGILTKLVAPAVQYKYDVFLICPVRNATTDELNTIKSYVQKLEADGKKVYWPYRDTDQVDSSGTRICVDNGSAIYYSREIHIFYNKESQGSNFDFGMAFVLKKPIKLINPEAIERTPSKSFGNVLLDLHEHYSK